MLQVLRKPTTLFLLAIATISLLLHVFLIPRLNIIEDESAYMQDAAQITSNFLPFREFGGTKGPLWLFIFHGWQKSFGHSLFVTRLFSSLAHIASIFLLWHFVRSFSLSKYVAYIAVSLWALSPVVVSLTTNITHIPLELCFVFMSFLCLRQKNSWYAMLSAIFIFIALLMRATAIAFAPAVLVLILIRPDRWALLWKFCIAGLFALGVTVAIVYQFYGWPKTAFFFNADALLIANKQREVYTAAEKVSGFHLLYDALLPLRLDGLSILIPTLFLPFIFAWKSWRKTPWPKALGLLLLIWISSFVLFYRGWGRSATPFYPLESIPALAIAGALVVDALLVWGKKRKLYGIVAIFFGVLFLADLISSYRDIPVHQYRGTVEVQAAEKVSNILSEQVKPGEHVFTAQPSFVYLADLPLYGGYTHPGWYLSERAGYLPSEIRSVFLPDFETLAGKVNEDITWIIVDWRTNDVYFNDKVQATEDLREVLAKKFELVATISNPASRDIRMYKRLKKYELPNI